MIQPEATPLEVLALAIKSEMEAASFYNRLARKVSSGLLREKVRFLAFEEKKHRAVLLRLSQQRFGQVPSSLPEKGISPAILLTSMKNLTVLDLFQAGLEAERVAELFYQEAKKIVQDELTRKILDYLCRVERSHGALILSEIDLLRRFPEHYDVAGFHWGEELVHVGP